MKKNKNKNKLLFISLSLALILMFNISTLAFNTTKYDGIEYKLGYYNYTNNTNQVSYNLYYKSQLQSIITSNIDSYFADWMLSELGLNYENIIQYASKNSSIYDANLTPESVYNGYIQSDINTGKIFVASENGDGNLTTNRNIMSIFITQFNNIIYTFNNTPQYATGHMLNECMLIEMNVKMANLFTNGCYTFLNFLYNYEFISESTYNTSYEKMLKYNIFADRLFINASSDEYSILNVVKIENIYGSDHYYIVNESFTNQSQDFWNSFEIIKNGATWSFLPPVIQRQILSIMTIIVSFAGILGIFKLLTRGLS